MRSALAVLAALSACAVAQNAASLPACVLLCTSTKVLEGYCPTQAFNEAYATCLNDNCQSQSDLQAGRALTQQQICAAASASGVSATGTITGAAATPTGTAGNAIGGGSSGAMSMTSPASTGSASAPAASASSSNSSSGAAAYVTGLQAALTGAGLTTLASLVPGIAQNTTLATALTTGNKTVFGPTDAAFAAAGASSLSAATVQTILTYHIVNGTFNASQIATAPNVTFVRSLLNSAPAVLLPGNAGQVIKLQRLANGSLAVGSNGTVVAGNATYQNLVLDVIPSVLTVPANISTTLSASQNYSTLASLVNSQTLQALQSVRGITVFLPTNAAFAKVPASALQQLQGNQTLLMNVLLNHVLNGTVAYSPAIASGNSTLTSASGEPLAVSKTASGITVSVGSNITANVIQPDIIIANGVAHGIDSVLVNTMSDANAAAQAASSAAQAGQAAATQGTNGGLIGGTGSSSSGNTGTGGSGGSGGSSGAKALFVSGAMLGLSLIGGFAVLA